MLIKIVDENDNFPIFSENVYTRRILEDSAINAIVVTLKAEDQDVGLNGQVVYSISTGNEKGGKFEFRLVHIRQLISDEVIFWFSPVVALTI